jgi:glutamate racemase
MANFKIGVFDSGLGGLTVLKELVTELPEHHFIYLGDTARLPYGTKSRVTVQKYAIQAAKFLISKGANALVIACNTASAMALDHLQNQLSIPVFGVIDASAEAAKNLTKSKKILVLATESTVRSEAYLQVFSKLGNYEIEQIPCPLLVPLAEEGFWDHEITKKIIEIYLEKSRLDFDTIVLGCTHYPLLLQSFLKVIKKEIRITEGSQLLAKKIAEQYQNIPSEKKLDIFLTDNIGDKKMASELFSEATFEITDLSF